jgi:hypothetical protein
VSQGRQVFFFEKKKQKTFGGLSRTRRLAGQLNKLGQNILRRPLALAAASMALYGALMLPTLAMHHFDLSDFVVAGEHYVDAGQTPSKLIIRHNSDGYDGQFTYRMAVAPLSFAPRAGGVMFDKPAWRMQRIIGSLLAWAVSLGQPAAVPAALFALNLAGLGVIAAISVLLCAQAGLPALLPLAIVLWPGFMVALTHDTTEILSEAFAIAAILCHVRRRTVAYGILAACATLTRETTLLIFAGMILYDAACAVRKAQSWQPVAIGVLALVPYLAWRETLVTIWPVVTPRGAITHDLGIPFAGGIKMLFDCITGARPWASTPLKNAILRAIVLFTATGVVAFCASVARCVPAALRRGGALTGLVVSWLMIAVLMSLLKASGPWVDPAGYFRAFTECYVVGCLVLGKAGWQTRHPGIVAVTGGAMAAAIWIYCTIQLRMT